MPLNNTTVQCDLPRMTMNNITQNDFSRTFVPPDVYSPSDVLSHGSFFSERFVLRTFVCRTFCLPDVLSAGRCVPPDVLSLDVMSPDDLCPDDSSRHHHTSHPISDRPTPIPLLPHLVQILTFPATAFTIFHLSKRNVIFQKTFP